MFEFIIAVLIASFAAVQLTKIVTNVLPSTINTAGKTIVAVVIEIIVGLLTALFAGFTVVRVLGTIGMTIVVSQFAYEYIFKPLGVLFDFLKEKGKLFIEKNKG